MLERQRGDESTARASSLALILHGKYLAMIAAGVRTNPFNSIKALRDSTERMIKSREPFHARPI